MKMISKALWRALLIFHSGKGLVDHAICLLSWLESIVVLGTQLMVSLAAMSLGEVP